MQTPKSCPRCGRPMGPVAAALLDVCGTCYEIEMGWLEVKGEGVK
jgi:uncharacterized OB-fold protein